MEAVKAAETAKAAKVELESKVAKLEEDLAGNRKELLTLQESAQKAAHTLGDLQTQLSAKSHELSQAVDAKEDLKQKLSTLEEHLEGAKAKEKILSKDLKEKAAFAGAENSFNMLKGSLQLWTNRLVEAAEQLNAQLAVMGLPEYSYSPDDHEAASAGLTLFFEGLVKALGKY